MSLCDRLGLRLSATPRACRACLRLAAVAGVLLAALPLQLIALTTSRHAANMIPMLVHKAIGAIIGLRRKVSGAPACGGALLVANHSSWLDIVALGACAPVAFAARADLATWPMLGVLARLQRTVFVERRSRVRAGFDAHALQARLWEGDDLVLFPEGTTSDGSRILPFKSALLACAPAARLVQAVALAYVAADGRPLDAAGRERIAWHGEKPLPGHLWEVLGRKSVQVEIRFADPVRAEAANLNDRKALAAGMEASVRAMAACASPVLGAKL